VEVITESEVAGDGALRMKLYLHLFTSLNGKLLKVQSNRTSGRV